MLADISNGGLHRAPAVFGASNLGISILALWTPHDWAVVALLLCLPVCASYPCFAALRVFLATS